MQPSHAGEAPAEMAAIAKSVQGDCIDFSGIVLAKDVTANRFQSSFAKRWFASAKERASISNRRDPAANGVRGAKDGLATLNPEVLNICVGAGAGPHPS